MFSPQLSDHGSRFPSCSWTGRLRLRPVPLRDPCSVRQPVAFGFLCETPFGFFFFTTFFFGTSALVFTGAVSLAVTSGPDGGVPVAVATLSNADRPFVFAHVYVTVAPGAIDASAGLSAFVLLPF